jgi:hypothetical protein
MVLAILALGIERLEDDAKKALYPNADARVAAFSIAGDHENAYADLN